MDNANAKKRVFIYKVCLLVTVAFLSACGNGSGAADESDSSVTVWQEAELEQETEEPESSETQESEQADTVEAAEKWSALREQMGFYVEGSTLCDTNGNPFVMRGINHAHCWYENQAADAISGIARTGSNCVRLVLADGEQWTPTSAQAVESLLDQCRSEKMVAILEVHDATGYKDKDSLLKAAQYFVDLRDILIGQEEYVIINIANEWQGDSESRLWKEAYQEAIPLLREAGLAHTIMIDSAGWGQYGRCIQEGGEELLAADPLGNVMFSVHMYGTAGGSESSIENNLRYATDNELCVCVGEFGYTHTDGDVLEDYLMQYCQDNQIGYIAWSWKGNGGGVEYLDLAQDWSGEALSADWGEVVVNGVNGIRETSRRCTVFEEAYQGEW
ncbi:MAG: glycoside hydrolase family 5 protein [bacterium]|nr:glycoside hydrolase family 5 protein [bacterium]MCM1375888.1 glycoside hydrolase family 5 protein [Muribaculum sp.]